MKKILTILLFLFCTSSYSQIPYKISEEVNETMYSYDILSKIELIDYQKIQKRLSECFKKDGYDVNSSSLCMYDSAFIATRKRYGMDYYIILSRNKATPYILPDGFGSLFISITYDTHGEELGADNLKTAKTYFAKLTKEKLIPILNECRLSN